MCSVDSVFGVIVCVSVGKCVSLYQEDCTQVWRKNEAEKQSSILQTSSIQQTNKHHHHHHHRYRYLPYLLQGQALLVETVDLLHRYAKLTQSGVRSKGVVIGVVISIFEAFVWCVSVVVLLRKK